MGILRPQTTIVLRAVRNESRLRRKAKKRVHRFRSWTKQRIQAFQNIHYPVVLTADTERMDANYLSRCFLKAALLKKHDLDLWKKYTQRAYAVAPQLSAENLAFIFYSYGRSGYPQGVQAIRALRPFVADHVSNLTSQGLACIVWALDRLRFRDIHLALRVAEEAVRRADQMRPIDCLKIFNSLAALGVRRCPITSSLSTLVVEKMNLLSSQNIRYALHPTALCQLHTPAAQRYIMHRVARVRSVLRPYHLRAMYRCGVALRVIHPKIYEKFLPSLQRYLTRLAIIRIPWDARYPSAFHWDVSTALVKNGIHHRNMFLWGCFWIHIRELDRKTCCWMVDPPAAFCAQSLIYRESVKLQHRILWHLGWDIRRVVWSDWVNLATPDEKTTYIKQKQESSPAGEWLSDVALPRGRTLDSCRALLEERSNEYKEQRTRRRRGPPVHLSY